MRLFTIGKYVPSDQRTDGVRFQALQDKVFEAIGVKDYLGCDDGWVYRFAENYGHFWLEHKDRDTGIKSYELIDGAKSTSPLPAGEFMCNCGSLSFYISYGSYECFGTCPNCGNRHSLYSG